MPDTEQPKHPTRTVKVFGSATLRVAPDTASILVNVVRVEQQPGPAFSAARQAAHAVAAYLHHRGLQDVGSSRITLSQEHRFDNGQQRFIGYAAHIGFNVTLHDLELVEETLTGLIAAGANELTSVTFQTSRLKEHRADARRRAIAAARDKAELYCAAAGASAGRVLAIEDANPDSLTARSGGHVRHEPTIDDPGDLRAIDPAAITVAAAVHVTYELADALSSPDVTRPPGLPPT